jgi:hypothetical protein
MKDESRSEFIGIKTAELIALLQVRRNGRAIKSLIKSGAN